MTPRPRAAVALAVVALSALVVPWQLALLAALAILVVTVVDCLVARRPPNVERTVPESVARGVGAPLVLEAFGDLRTTVRQPQTAELRVEPRDAVGTLTTKVVAIRRGAHTLPAPATRVDGPLRVGSWIRRVGEDTEIRVFPDLPGARRLARAAQGGRYRSAGLRRGPLGLGTEFEAVREYHDDDDVRQINWRATQRVGHPMSNQFRVEREREVHFLVDCGRLTAAPVGESTRLDVALDTMLAVAATADELGDRSGAIAFDDGIRARFAPRRRGAATLAHGLFDLEPRPVESDYARAFAEISGAKRAFVLIFTDLIDESAARSLLAALPVLARRHAVTVHSITDPDLQSIVEDGPVAPIDVYRQVVATDVLSDRARVRHLLGRAGADVVETPVGASASACITAYLRAKQRARL